MADNLYFIAGQYNMTTVVLNSLKSNLERAISGGVYLNRLRLRLRWMKKQTKFFKVRKLHYCGCFFEWIGNQPSIKFIILIAAKIVLRLVAFVGSHKCAYIVCNLSLFIKRKADIKNILVNLLLLQYTSWIFNYYKKIFILICLHY